MSLTPLARSPRFLAVCGAVLAASASTSCARSLGPPSDVLAVTSVNPAAAPAGGEVRLAGFGFRDRATVTFAGIPAAATVVSPSQMMVIAPDHPPGAVQVVVTNSDGASSALNQGFTYIPFSIDRVEPNAGFPNLRFWTYGRGFMTGARLGVGGTNIATADNSEVIVGLAPAHDLGPADVTIANPGTRSVTLRAGFTYYASPVIGVTPTVVAPGGSLQVSFDVSLTSGLDWIGLYALGADNRSFLASRYLAGLTGTVTFSAPIAAGQYQFRYLPLDGYEDFARSEVVRVTESASPAARALAGLFGWTANADRLPRPGSSGRRVTWIDRRHR